MNPRVLLEVIQCRDMTLGQIHDMNVVTHACAVWCVVVLAVHAQFTQLAHRDLRDEGHQVVGDAVGILTNQTRRMRTHGVEITQYGQTPSGV